MNITSMNSENKKALQFAMSASLFITLIHDHVDLVHLCSQLTYLYLNQKEEKTKSKVWM